jgi:hypothetical protein
MLSPLEIPTQPRLGSRQEALVERHARKIALEAGRRQITLLDRIRAERELGIRGTDL